MSRSKTRFCSYIVQVWTHLLKTPGFTRNFYLRTQKTNSEKSFSPIICWSRDFRHFHDCTKNTGCNFVGVVCSNRATILSALMPARFVRQRQTTLNKPGTNNYGTNNMVETWKDNSYFSYKHYFVKNNNVKWTMVEIDNYTWQ